MSMPSNAVETLNRDWLPLRAALIDLAATLDRIDRAEGSVDEDARWAQIQQSLAVLSAPEANRAEQIQLIFSLPYEPNWRP
ncbi:MAG: hypothetical protein JW818_07285 [Pirellulales bacterium]|nr:hypothetical protein [Pirellulales bacterium]